MGVGTTVATTFVVGLIFLIVKTFRIIPTRHHVVKERLGKFAGVLQPGFHFFVPFIDRASYTQEMREQALDIPPQSCITRDNIQVEVDGIVYLKVMDAKKASYGIADYRQASVNLAQTTMRSEIGKLDLDDTFSERDRINENIVREIDKASDPWGIKMIRYEIRNITPSHRVIDTMEKQMEAERAKRAAITVSTGKKESNILVSEGERQEAINLSEGSRQKRINEAQGQAEEIRMIAEAKARGVDMVAAAIRKPGGELAVKTQLVEQYLEQFGQILSKANVSVVPSHVANIRGVMDGISHIASNVNGTNGKGR